MTTGINAQNTQQQYEIIALLTCLEALLGVTNACLPVMKPIFTKIGATSIFSSTRTRAPSMNRGIRSSTPRASRKNHQSFRGVKYPHISPPRQIVHKESLLIFSSDLPTDVQAPSIPLPSFSWRPLSRYYLPRAEWKHDPSELRKDNGIGVTTDWDLRYRRSEGNSPTLPWHSPWQNHHQEAIERC